jgi:amidase
MSSPDFSGKKRVVLAAASVVAVMLGGRTARGEFDVVEKNIPQLEAAYTSGATTVQDVINQYLGRIRTYDDRLNGVNAVGQINPALSAAVAQAQARINGGATTAQFPLLGVPVLVKDAYDVAGMITTNGVSVLNGAGPAATSTTLVAPNDAPSVAALRAAGAIILGKTNMSTMAYAFDGIDNAHGVVRNPYNYNRQPGGSSSGSGAATASNFAMLTMGGETGGSIRIPSAYNGVVGIKTSSGLVSPNGTWPLTPTRDVAGPIGKTVSDVAYAMNALAVPTTDANNIWRNTPYYPAGGVQPGAVGTGLGEGSSAGGSGLTAATGTRPVDYTSFLSTTALQGKVIAVPNSVVRSGAADTTKAYEATFNTAVYDNFQTQLNVLRAQGATIVNVDVPAEVLYFSTLARPSASGGATTAGFNDKAGNPIPYPTTTTGGTTPSSTFSTFAAAYYYEKQIEGYGDPKVKNLRDFATALRAGATAGSGNPNSTLGGAATNIENLATVYEQGNAKGFSDADNDGSPDNPDAIKALQAFSTVRQQYVNDWLTSQGIDALVEPSMSGVAPLVGTGLRNTTSSDYSITAVGSGGGNHNGRFLGNILGMPAVSVPSGTLGADNNILWTGIQFLGRLDSEAFLLGLAYDYEQATLYRFAPNLDLIPEPASLSVLCFAGFALVRRPRRVGPVAAC